MALKAVLFGLDGVLKKRGKTAVNLPPSVGIAVRRLFDYLRDHEITPVILLNQDRTMTDRDTGTKETIDKWLEARFGSHTLYVAARGHMPYKPQKTTISTVLAKLGLAHAEVMYVGSSTTDFRTAINSKLLFLNATWDSQDEPYGFTFSSPNEVGRFIGVYGLKEHPWFYQIDFPIQLRSLGPFSTFKAAYEDFSRAARRAAKEGTPERHFFLNSLAGSLNFTRLARDLNYIACYPGHKIGYGNPYMNDVLTILGNCLRAPYIPDLIVRHTKAPQSRALRREKKKVSPLSQLNTIRLTKKPWGYKTPVKLKGKRVLVVDDFSTEGYSFEAARLYLEEAGAEVLLASWLKTINTGYEVLEAKKKFDPYKPKPFTTTDISITPLRYKPYIVDKAAPTELGEALALYRAWEYPT